MSIDAMKQALEALEAWNYLENPKPDANVIAALRAAIEQAQKPVAWISESENLLSWDKFYDHMTPLYTAPRQWQGLTDEEIDTLYEAHHNQYGECKVVGYGYERAIEAKLKEKNT